MNTQYIKLDMTNANYANAITMLTARFHNHYPNNILSINKNKDNTMAWVKISVDTVPTGPVVLDSATYETRQKVIDEVTQVSWTGPIARPHH